MTAPDQASMQFAANAAALMDAHPWMDHTTVNSVASTATDPQTAVDTGTSMGQAIRNTWDGFTQSYSDPVLAQQPSPGLAVGRYVHETIGPPPIEAGSLPQIQQALLDHGVGAGLTPDGAWTAQWQQAWNAQMQKEYADQLAGEKAGSVKTSTFLHRVLHLFTPAGAGDALIGWGKDVRATVGDVLGSFAGTGDDLVGGNGKALFNSISQHTVNALGGHTSAAAERKRHANPLNLVGDVLTISGVGGLAKGVGKAALGQVLKRGATSAVEGATTAAAERTAATVALAHANDVGQSLGYTARLNIGGSISQTVRKIGEDYSRHTIPAESAELVRKPGVIAKTLFRGDRDRLIGPMPKQWYANMPLVSRLAPAIAKTADSDGWYYKTRSAFAQPYRYAPVRAVGQAYAGVQRAAVIAAGQAAVLPGSDFAHNINDTNTLDAWSANLANAGPRFLGMSLTDPNNAQILLHGPLAGADRSSQAIGELARASNNHLIDVLGSKGFLAAIQQALRTGNTIMSRKDMLAAVGGDPLALNQFQRSLAMQVARAHFIERGLGKPLDGTDANALDDGATLDDKFWKTPGVAAQSLKESLEGDPDVQWATNRLTQIFQKLGTDPRTALANAYKEWHDVTTLGRTAHDTGDMNWFQTSRAQAVLGDMRAAAAEAHYNANAPAPWERASHHALNDTYRDYNQGLASTDEVRAAKDAVVAEEQGYRDAAARHAKSAVSQADAMRTLPQQTGMFGIANASYQTSTDVARKVAVFGRALKAADGDPAATEAVADDMRQYLFENAARDARELGVFTPTPEKLLAQIRDWGATQAGDVTLRYGAPDAVGERFAAVQAAGYKYILGTHIGHVIDGTEPDLGSLGNYTAPLRRWAQRVGLNPSNIRDTDVGRASHLSMLQALIDAKGNDARIKWGARVTPNTIMGLLVKDKAIDDAGLPWYSASIVTATRKVGLNKSVIERSIAKGSTRAQAQADHEASLAYQQSIRDLPRKQIIDTLQNPQDVTLESGASWHWPGMSEQSANLTYAALMRGFKLPTYMMGLSAIENWARAGAGFGDAMTHKLNPDTATGKTAQYAGNLLDKVGSWPNAYVRVRNQLRFTLNPRFDEQRLTKTSYKMGLEGVPPVKNPLATLDKTDAADEAMARYQRLTGDLKPEEMQHLDADKYAKSQSLFGIYSPIWHAAYFMHAQALKGMTDSDIVASYHRAFTYGSGGGRSAFERSINTILFPFSFEKTVLRNGVGYLLDHPGQALMLSAAVDEWRKLDKNDAVGTFMKSHLPALVLLNQLNAFAHGISPGQLGGINAPLINPIVNSIGAGASMPSHDPGGLLLNLFTPQVWAANYTKANLQQMAPLWKEFGQVWKAGADQSQVAFNLAANGMDDLTGAKTRPRTLIAPSAQLDYALRAKANMIAQASHIIDYNNKQSIDGDKVHWPPRSDIPASVQNQVVNRASIGLFVQSLYPAYSPTAAADAASKKAVAADKFIATLAHTDPTSAAEMTKFKTVANQLIGRINRDEVDPARLAVLQENFRKAAKNLAEKSPQWLTFYNRYYASRLGPIEDFTGHGVTP